MSVVRNAVLPVYIQKLGSAYEQADKQWPAQREMFAQSAYLRGKYDSKKAALEGIDALFDFQNMSKQELESLHRQLNRKAEELKPVAVKLGTICDFRENALEQAQQLAEKARKSNDIYLLRKANRHVADALPMISIFSGRPIGT